MNSPPDIEGSSDMMKGIEIIKAIIASSAIFLPLVGFVYDAIHNSDKIRSPFDCSPIIYLLRSLSRSVSHIEVAVELISRTLFGERNRLRMVVTIEALKMILRLSCLFGQSEVFMILDWGRKAPSEKSFQSYYDHYKADYDRILRKIMASSDFSPIRRTATCENSSHPSTTGPYITGRRSGLKITLKSGLATMLQLEDPDVSGVAEHQSVTSTSAEADINKRGVYLRHAERIPVDNFSPGTILVNSIVNLSDFNTPIKDEAMIDKIGESPPPVHTTSDDAGGNDRDINEIDKNAQYLFLISEVLYIIRPFIYSVLQYGLITDGSAEQEPFQSDDTGPKFGALSSIYQIISQNIKWEIMKNIFPLIVGTVLEFVSIQMSYRSLMILRERARQNAFIHRVQKEELGELSYNTLQLKYEGDIIAKEQKGTAIAPHVFDEELRRRKTMLYLCLLRSPLFDRATLPVLKKFCGLFQNIPLIGSIPNHGLALLLYLNKIHFYTANS